MRLAISHIAWDASEDDVVADLLRRYDVDAIDIAPSTYFPDPSQASDDDIEGVRRQWARRGIEITGMQALLFGASGLNLFGPPDVQEAMLGRLKAACRIGAGVGASRLVFGSPRNRDRTGLSDKRALEVALPFFRRLGDLADSFGVTICLEPNPPRYGANFMTTARETASVVRQVNHPAIRIQFDTGALVISEEDPASFLEENGALVGHVHLSEPDLVPLGDGLTPHALIAKCLRQHLPRHVATIEMLPTRQEPHLGSVERALRAAVSSYRGAGATGTPAS